MTNTTNERHSPPVDAVEAGEAEVRRHSSPSGVRCSCGWEAPPGISWPAVDRYRREHLTKAILSAAHAAGTIHWGSTEEVLNRIHSLDHHGFLRWACSECRDGAGDGWLCVEHQEERWDRLKARIETVESEYREAVALLRRVVPVGVTHGVRYGAADCDRCGARWPCPQAQAIAFLAEGSD